MSEKKLKLKFGDKWYIKLPNAFIVSEVEIILVTKRIVKISTKSNTAGKIEQLFEISDIKFIEKIK